MPNKIPTTFTEIQVFSTGSISLDLALGIGGIPRGHITEIFGRESSGKTTLGLHVIAEAQKVGGTCAFIDMEHALDPSYAARCGVDVNDLLISQPDIGDQALEISETLLRSGAVDVVVIDSVAALVPRVEIEERLGEAEIGAQARMMSQALRRLSNVVKQTNSAVLFTNQLRQKIGYFLGNPETTPGGLALKLYASIRLELQLLSTIYNGREVIGHRILVRVVKNKLAPPFRSIELDILYNEGISRAADLLDLGADLKIIKKQGSHYFLGDLRLGKNRESATEFLQKNQSIAREIEQNLRENILPPSPMPLEVD